MQSIGASAVMPTVSSGDSNTPARMRAKPSRAGVGLGGNSSRCTRCVTLTPAAAIAVNGG